MMEGIDSVAAYLCAQPKNTVSVPARYFESGQVSDAGVAVTPESAKTYSSVWEALQIISGDIARVALNLYYRSKDGRTPRQDLPVWSLLNRKAAGYMTAYTLRETMQQQALLQGNAYAQIVRDGAMRPLSLVLLDPTQTMPYVEEDGSVRYISRQLRREFAADEIFHLKGLGDNGLIGLSVVTLARTSFGMGLAAEKHGASTFKNGARPDLVIKTPARLNKTEADQLLDQWERRHGGAGGNSRPALIGGGMEVVPFPVSNEDAQWLQSRAFQRVEVASWFCLPPHKLGDSSRAGYNGVEAEERSYVNQTLMRWFARWQSEANDKLLTEREKRENAYWEHNVDALIQGDFSTQTDTLTKLRGAMIITQNEARAKLNLPSVPGGDTFENPATSSGGGTPQPQASIPTPALKSLLCDRAERLIRTEASQLLNSAKSKHVAAAIEKVYDAFEPKLIEALEPVLQVINAAGIDSPTAKQLASSHCSESKALVLSQLLDSGTPADMLKAELTELTKDWHETRSAAIVSAVFGA